MIVPNIDFPLYYDGSAHVEFSEEMTGEMKARLEEATYSKEEWRRFIGANPFGQMSHESQTLPHL